jgi:Dockerin type I domain
MHSIRFSILLITLATAAVYGQATLYLDARDSIGAIDFPTPSPVGGFANNPLGGNRGDGQMIYISPRIGNTGIETRPPFDTAIATMTLYMDYDAAPDVVVTSFGIDFAISTPAANERELANVSATIHNSGAEVGGPPISEPWSDTMHSMPFTTSGGGIQMYRLPYELTPQGPVFNAGLGLTAGDGYRLATIDIEAGNCANAGTRGCESHLDVFMSVNDQLIAAQDIFGATAPIALNLGYNGAFPEAATGNGSTVGATSAIPDATIIVRLKGDFNGDGNFNGLDLPFVIPCFNASISTTADQVKVFTGDFNGDGAFNGTDLSLVIPFYLATVDNCDVCP